MVGAMVGSSLPAADEALTGKSENPSRRFELVASEGRSVQQRYLLVFVV
jgi:hypothetical protein